MNCRKLSQSDGWEVARLVWEAKPQEAAPAPATAPTTAIMKQQERKVEAPKEPVVAKPVEVVALAGQQAEGSKQLGKTAVAQANEAINAKTTGSGAGKTKAAAPSEATETTSKDADLNQFIENLMSDPTGIADAKTIEELETKIEEAISSTNADEIEAQLTKKLLTISETDQREFRKKYLKEGVLNQEALKKAVTEKKFKAQELVAMLSIMGKGDISKFFGGADSPAAQRFEQILPNYQEMLKTKQNLDKITNTLNQYKDNKDSTPFYDKLLEAYKKGEEPSEADKKAFVDSIKNADDKKIIEEALDTNKEHDKESEIVRLLKFDNKDFTKEDVMKAVESGKLNFREAQIAMNILKAGSVPETKKTDIWESLEKLIAMLTALANKFIASLDKQIAKNEPKHFEKSPWGTGDKKFALDTQYEKGKNNDCISFKEMEEGTSIYAMEAGTIKIQPEKPVKDAKQTVSIISSTGAEIQYLGLDPEKLVDGSPVKAGDKIGTTALNVRLKLKLLDKDKNPVDPTGLLAPYIKTEAKK